MVSLHIFYCLAVINLVVFASANNYTLKSLYVLFRHGDRAPRNYPDESYPTDPYRGNPFYPVGFGGLTNKGKTRLYNFGNSLRERYDNYLGDIYWPNDVKVLSTGTDRTKMSLSIVLAALYPPKGGQVWKENFNWQPIPINYIDQENDPYFTYWNCSIYNEEFKRVRNSQEHSKELSQFDELMKKLTYFTGRKVENTEFIYYLFHTLSAQNSMNLTLPEWTKPYFPNGPLLDAALFEYDVMSYNTKLKRLNGGMSLRKILDDIYLTLNKSSTSKPKIHMYSAHESNIGGILQTLNLWKKVIPEYTSSIIFELYEENSKYFLKILYYKGIPSEYEELRIPECSDYCPFEEFIRITKEVIPHDVKEECHGSNDDSKK